MLVMKGIHTKPTEHAAQMKGNEHKILIGKSHDNYLKEINIYVYICNDNIKVFLNEMGSE
jgi:hypothetical protein